VKEGGRLSRIEQLRTEFLNPGKEYTPIPFWFWNDLLTPEEIIRQIADFAEKGVLGFVIHPRIGLPPELEFLSPRYLDLMEVAIKEAERRGMVVFLYDEAMYPSGSAHGRVAAANPEFACRGIRVLEYPLPAVMAFREILEQIKAEISDNGRGGRVVSLQVVKKRSATAIEPSTLQVFDLLGANVEQKLDNYYLLALVEEAAGGTIRGIHFGEDDHEAGAPLYADILNPAAVQEFINQVYETYYERFKQYFGRTIRAIFTDEPKPLGRNSPSIYRPWTKDFLSYLKANGFAEEKLPLLWYDGGPETAVVRREFARLVNQRLAEAYYQPLAAWCAAHQVALTGHPAEADQIGLLDYFHIPGQDVVLNRIAPGKAGALEGRESTQAKCSADAARHRRKRRNANECFGGYGWRLTMAEMKWILDWLFVRGVNLIIPHAFYYSLAPPRERERPPDVGPHNLWWPHYWLLATYIKRLCWLLTDSVNQARAAVLCAEDDLSWEIAKPLFQHQLEFNYLQVELFLADSCSVKHGWLEIEAQQYRLLILDHTVALTEVVRQKLAAFREGGGHVLYYAAGRSALPSVPAAMPVVRNEEELVRAVQRVVGYTLKFTLHCPELRVTHLQKEGADFYLLVNEGETALSGTVEFDCAFRLEKWEPWTGKIITPAGVTSEVNPGKKTYVIRLGPRESLILLLHQDQEAEAPESDLSLEAWRETGKQPLTDGWRVEGFPVPVTPADYFQSWSEIQELKGFSGTVSYKTKFSLTTLPDRLLLDCGEVYDFIEVKINGRSAGVRFWPPFTFELGAELRTGLNELELQVTNTLACRYEKKPYRSGLLGPVVLRFLTKGESNA